jgi:hypothetical protein
MPSVNFDTMDIDVQVKSEKRRFKIPSAKFRTRDATEEEEKRKSNIFESRRWKPYKTRAIQRARALKYTDGRGEEAEIDMYAENLSSQLSSRVACPFEIRRVHIERKHRVEYNGTHHIIRPVTVEHEQVILRGTLYEGKTNITVIHEVNCQPLHYVDHTNHICFQDTFEEDFDYPCEYKMIMKKLKQIYTSRIDV